MLHYSPGSCQRIEQAGHVGRSLACLDKNDESGPTDYEGAGDLLAQRCQGAMQFYQKRAGRRAQKSGEFFTSHRQEYGNTNTQKKKNRETNQFDHSVAAEITHFLNTDSEICCRE